MDPFLAAVWTKLREVRRLTFTSTSQASEKTGWAASAEGEVRAELESSSVLIYHEAGVMTQVEGKSMKFTNTYRWTQLPDFIRLEHLRFGARRPLFLFDLVPDSKGGLVSASPHVCSEDLYSAKLIQGKVIRLTWRVTGPSKDETVDYTYFYG